MFYDSFKKIKAISFWNTFTKAQKDRLNVIKRHIEHISDKNFPEKLSFIEFLDAIENVLKNVNSIKELTDDVKNTRNKYEEAHKNLKDIEDKIYHLNESDKKFLAKLETYDLIDKFFQNPTVDSQYGKDALVIWHEDDHRVSVSRYKVEKETNNQPVEYAFGCYPVKSFYEKFTINPNKLTPLETKKAYNAQINKALKELIEKV